MILVTGSTGYIGSRLVRQLLAEKTSIRGLVLPSEIERGRALEGLGMEVWRGDLLSPESLRGIAQDVTVAFHLAGIHSPTLDYVRRLYVDGTHNLISECLDTVTVRCCVPVKTIDDGLRTLIADMFEQMDDAPGIGLAV